MAKRPRTDFEGMDQMALKIALRETQNALLQQAEELEQTQNALSREEVKRKREEVKRKREEVKRKREKAKREVLQRDLSTAKQDITIRKEISTILRSHAEASALNCGSLETCGIDDILKGVPAVGEAAIRTQWESLIAAQPVLPSDDEPEIPAMHKFFLDVLWKARPSSSELVIRHEKKASVADSNASVIPDISLSNMRNASFSMHTLDFSLELKRRAKAGKKRRRLMTQGDAEAMDYGTRKAEHAFELLVERGAMQKAVALSAFSNGDGITFKRVELSRDPADSDRPVRKMTTEPLALLPQSIWQDMVWPLEAPDDIPPGFRALVRILSATSAELGNQAELLDTVQARMPRRVAEEPVTLTLGARLGLGGFGDVYAVTDGASSGAPDGRDDVVVKVPRSRSLVSRRLVVKEARALTALGQLGPVRADHPAGLPVLLSLAPPPEAAGTGSSLWDPKLENGAFPEALVLAPLGVPVEKVLSDLLSMDSPPARFSRRRFARHVAKGVRAALLYAHLRGWTHLDVRPSNVVLVRGEKDCWLDSRVVVVDWALAERIGTQVRGLRGVPDFVHEDIIKARDSTWTASPLYDVFAEACMFSALAFGDVLGDHAYPPWDGHRVGVDTVVPLREAWFAVNDRCRRSLRSFVSHARTYSKDPAGGAAGLPELWPRKLRVGGC